MKPRITIPVGEKCNNNCLFCYQRGTFKFNVSRGRIDAILEANKGKYEEACFSNNEPTIREDIFDIVQKAKGLGFRVYIQTNGRMFSYPSFSKKIVDAGLTGASFSIHGTSEIHDALTCVKGSYLQSVKGIRNLIYLGIKPSTLTVINKYNYAKLRKISRSLLHLGIRDQIYAFIDPTGKALDNFYQLVPRMSLTIPYIRRLLDSNPGKISIRGMPYCLMSEHRHSISEFYDETMVLNDGEIEDVKKFRKGEGKIMFESCKGCEYAGTCEGVWKEYPKYYGTGEFNPRKETHSKRRNNLTTGLYNLQDQAGIAVHNITLTDRCNLKCAYCQASNRRANDMTMETANQVINFITKNASKQINVEFQGGEPLMRFDLLTHIVKNLRRKHNNVNFIIGTNLTLMNEDKLKFIVENDIQVSTSIDGPAEIHDKNRPFIDKQGSLKDTVFWMKKLNAAYRNRRVHSSPTFTKDTLSKYKIIVDYYLKEGIEPIQSRHLDRLGSADYVWKEAGYKAEDYINMMTNYLDYLLALNRDGVFVRDRMMVILLKNILSDERICPCVSKECMAVTGLLTYDPKGDIYPCEYFRYTNQYCLGNVSDTTYHDILKQKSIRDIIKNSSVFNKYCNGCDVQEYCGVCVFRRMQEGGSFYADPNKTAACKIVGPLIRLLLQKLDNPTEGKILRNWVK
ncbi:radical SAM protein [Candidatus Woesearchaeota archaeon]|nr:radical SAM protein [Candidatus Woesearchaeota archaeon]